MQRALGTGDRRVAVVGGGPTGIQLAAGLAPRASVTLVEVGPELLPDFPAPRAGAPRDLRRLGVDVRLRAAAASLDPEGLDLADGGRVEARTVLWAAGVEPSPLAARRAPAWTAPGASSSAAI